MEVEGILEVELQTHRSMKRELKHIYALCLHQGAFPMHILTRGYAIISKHRARSLWGSCETNGAFPGAV